jgi:NTP pyrophosphatase (non-canonical NTP hydrolase)
MPSVLTPILQDSNPSSQVQLPSERQDASAFPKQDTKEYLADMLRELSAIAAWAELENTRALIEDALREMEAEQGNT